MVKAVIFDLGGVLYRFDPDYIARDCGLDGDDLSLVKKAVFDRRYWDKLDDGSFDDDDCMAAYRADLPERLWDKADDVFKNWVYRLEPIDGMEEMVDTLMARGVRCYVLSDISRGFSRAHSFYPLLDRMTGLFFSGDLRLTKPHRKTFEAVLARAGLRACDTVFVDDKETNVAGAEAAGIKGVVFDGNAQHLKQSLLTYLKE